MRRYVFHYIVDDEVVYMCMADKDSKRRIPFAYLNDIKSRFEEMYGDTIKTAVENNMNEEFSKVMEKRMVWRVFVLVTRSGVLQQRPVCRHDHSRPRPNQGGEGSDGGQHRYGTAFPHYQ